MGRAPIRFKETYEGPTKSSHNDRGNTVVYMGAKSPSAAIEEAVALVVWKVEIDVGGECHSRAAYMVKHRLLNVLSGRRLGAEASTVLKGCQYWVLWLNCHPSFVNVSTNLKHHIFPGQQISARRCPSRSSRHAASFVSTHEAARKGSTRNPTNGPPSTTSAASSIALIVYRWPR